MMKSIVAGILAASMLWGCNQKENNMLKAKIDSLKTEVAAGQKAAGILTEVGHLMDSIQAQRAILKEGMENGIDYAHFSNLVSALSGYIHDTDTKLLDLESSLKQSKASANAFAAMTANLKKELEVASQQLNTLRLEAEKYRQENIGLTKTVSQKDSVLALKTNTIKTQIDSLAALENKIEHVSKTSTTTQADLYFEQGKALEMAASRTHFAPKKKKETIREALESYKRSFSLGKADAKSKIEELEKVAG